MIKYMLCAILEVVGLVWGNIIPDESDVSRLPFRGNLTGRGLLATTTDPQRKDLPFPDFFVLGAMKCGTTSLVTLLLTLTLI